MMNSTGLRRSLFWAMSLVALMLTGPSMLMRTTVAQDRTEPPKSSDTDTRPYNKHDLNGFWAHATVGYGIPPCPECNWQGGQNRGGYGFNGDVPPRTPAGERALQMRKMGRGFEPNSKEAQDPNLDSAYKRAGLPGFGNDPEARCEPIGLIHLIVSRVSPMEMVHTQTNDRIIQKFEWFWDNRDIWLDGRQLPKVEDYLPRYNGYSVGKWEGDTLVVTTTGFDDRQWIDGFGFPISEKAVLVERWARTSLNRLHLQMTLTDPVNYTRPWNAAEQIWALIPKDKAALSGWYGMLEDRCVPSDEARFNTYRDKAAGITR